jgi:hypothetical protein
MTNSQSGQIPDRTALILYGSQTGNSQDVAEDLGRLAQRLRFATRVCEMDQVKPVCLPLHLYIQSNNPKYSFPHAIGHSAKSHFRYLCGWDHWARRVPEKCTGALEEPSEEAFASGLSVSAQLYHLWTGR